MLSSQVKPYTVWGPFPKIRLPLHSLLSLLTTSSPQTGHLLVVSPPLETSPHQTETYHISSLLLLPLPRHSPSVAPAVGSYCLKKTWDKLFLFVEEKLVNKLFHSRRNKGLSQVCHPADTEGPGIVQFFGLDSLFYFSLCVLSQQCGIVWIEMKARRLMLGCNAHYSAEWNLTHSPAQLRFSPRAPIDSCPN